MNIKLHKNGSIVLRVIGSDSEAAWTWNITETLHPKFCDMIPDRIYSVMLDTWMDAESQQLARYVDLQSDDDLDADEYCDTNNEG